MSLHSPLGYIIPQDTFRVAHAAFPKSTLVMQVGDEFGMIYTNAQFAALFPHNGQPALDPARLALVLVLQFLEGLSDRQAADAVRDPAGLIHVGSHKRPPAVCRGVAGR